MSFNKWTNKQKAEYILEKLKEFDIPMDLLAQIYGWLQSGDNAEDKNIVLQGIFEEIFKEKYGNRSEKSYRMLRKWMKKMGGEWEGEAINVKQNTFPLTSRRNIRWKRIAKIAAAVGLMVAIGAGVRLAMASMGTEEVIIAMSRIESGDQKREIILPCGTEVVMNKNTVISYTEETYEQSRVIELEGEAYLTVEKLEGIPFHVRTKNLTVDVLGTIFSMNARPEAEETKVSLYEGAVMVQAGNVNTELKPFEEFCLNNENGTSEVGKVSGVIPDWMSNPNKVKLSEIAEILKKNYGVEVIIKNGINTDLSYVFSLDKGDALDYVISILNEISGNITYNLKSDTVFINQ